MKQWIGVIGVLASTCVNAVELDIAAIDWCPQICMNKEKPGYVVELVNTVFKGSDYQLNVEIYPWSEAIERVSSGKADALLSPAKAEAPDLLYPQSPVGEQSMCFFTLKNSRWNFKGVESLRGLDIGIAYDTSIEELNNYAKANPTQFQFLPYHERYIRQSLEKLEKNQVDTFVFTLNTTIYEMQTLGIKDRFRIAGCVSTTDIYMAFSPVDKVSSEAAMALFDQRMIELNQSGFILGLMKKYGL